MSVKNLNNLKLEEIKKINNNELTHFTDVIVNSITLINIVITSAAIITEHTGKITISNLLYDISSFLAIFTIVISLIFKIIFKKNSPNSKIINNNSKLNSEIKVKIKNLRNIKHKTDIENLKKIKFYNTIFFIILLISLVISFLEIMFENINKINLSDCFYDVNNYIIIGLTVPILIVGLILKYRINKQYKSLLENFLYDVNKKYLI